MSDRMPFAARLAAAAALLGCVGCGADPLQTYRVRGKLVTAAGSPFESAGNYLVTFRAEVPMPAGGVKPISGDAPVLPDGTFRPSTFRFEDGLVAGKHEVTITPLAVGPGAAAKDAPKARLPGKYGNTETSGLTATVTPDSTEVVITVEAKK